MNPILEISFNSLMMGMVSLRVYNNRVYSLSVHVRAISVYNDDLQTIGHPLYDITKPFLDLAVSVFTESSLSQFHAKSASTCISMPLSVLVKYIVPFFIGPFKYLPKW